jgi:hypothetical protein
MQLAAQKQITEKGAVGSANSAKTRAQAINLRTGYEVFPDSRIRSSPTLSDNGCAVITTIEQQIQRGQQRNKLPVYVSYDD